MNTIRENFEKLEHSILGADAVFSDTSLGRRIEESEDMVRTCFQRDIDRIVHSKAFRRLKHKTQVFLQPEGDHYRTRMTHTLEVARLARTVARALRLNEDLTEAIAFGHDLGHTPFGHAGERALQAVAPFPFEHNEQSARVVEHLERKGAGLNLCFETVDGIAHHSGPEKPKTKEGAIVRICDRAAYVNHDLDDAIRAGVLTEKDIPEELVAVLGTNYSERINSAIVDLIETSAETRNIGYSPTVYFAMESFRDFMFERVYVNPIAKGEEGKAEELLKILYEYYNKRPELLPEEYLAAAEKEGAARAVCDYIAGMTDTYALYTYNNLFLPASWRVR